MTGLEHAEKQHIYQEIRQGTIQYILNLVSASFAEIESMTYSSLVDGPRDFGAKPFKVNHSGIHILRPGRE